jgi:hypothetical protein
MKPLRASIVGRRLAPVKAGVYPEGYGARPIRYVGRAIGRAT